MIVPRIAASSYSNTAPLIWSFWHGARVAEVDLITDAAPARCAALLAAGEVVAALTPVIEYQRIANVVAVPGVCIGSRNRVQSVVLITNGDDLQRAKKVALDTSSRTSVALVEIVFREFYNHQPELVRREPDLEAMLTVADAALLIGDPALRVDRDKFRVFDTVAVWRDFTGLGFIFALWLARTSDVEAIRKIDFATARDEGLQRLPEIVEFYKKDVPLLPADFKHYLTDSIIYQPDETMLAGLELFFRLAAKHKIIASHKPLQWLK